MDLQVDPNSSRLQLLEPFKAWDGKDVEVHILSADVLTMLLTCLLSIQQHLTAGVLAQQRMYAEGASACRMPPS